MGSHGYRLLVSARLATVTIGVANGERHAALGLLHHLRRARHRRPGRHPRRLRPVRPVDVKFHATAPAARGLPPDCFGGTTGAATIPGYFTGTIDFEGQGGYTAVAPHRIRGEVVLPPTEQCPLVAGGANPLVEDPSAELPRRRPG